MKKSVIIILNTLKNGSQIGKKIVKVKYNKKIVKVLNILIKEGYIKSYQQYNGSIVVIIGFHRINSIQVISKSGTLCNAQNKDLWVNQNNLVIRVMSSAEGIFTDKQLRELNKGGLFLFNIFLYTI